MSNVWKRFKGLLPSSPTKVGTVTATLSTGKAVVNIQGEGSQIVRNGLGASVADRVFVIDGEIVAETTTLSSGTIDI